MSFLFFLFITFFSFCSLCPAQAGTWAPIQPKKTIKSKIKVWQVQVSTPEGVPLIYLVQTMPAQIRIFAAHTKYHHPLLLESFGIHKITDVGLAKPLEGRGQVLYLGDKTTQRVLYIVLGKKKIKEFPLAPGLPAYKEFIAQLHPVSEAERHL